VDHRRRRPDGHRRQQRRRPGDRRVSIAHQITGSAAWVAALIMMALADVLTRLAVVYARGRRLATAPVPALISDSPSSGGGSGSRDQGFGAVAMSEP
jgi:hypothetical protein